MILVDSNIWIYYIDAATKEHTKVREALPKVLIEDVMLPTIVQMEVVHHLINRLGPAAQAHVETFLAQAAEIEPLSGTVTLEASRLVLSHHDAGIGGRDACILVMAKKREAKLLTHDKALAKVAKGLSIPVSDPAA